MLETKYTLDGGLRASISLAGREDVPHGWMTLVMKDGVSENARLLAEADAAEGGALRPADGSTAIGDVPEPVASRQTSAGMAFVL